MKNKNFIQKKKEKTVIFFIFLFTLLIGYSTLFSTTKICASSKTIFIPISQSQNLYTQSHLPLVSAEGLEFNLSLTYRFQQANNGQDIAESIFQTNPLVFAGSINNFDEGRPKNALVPEYFGLAPDTTAQFKLNPRIRNQIIDMQFYCQIENYWFQTNIPLVKAQWKPTNNRIENDTFVGLSPLQEEAQIYVYNIGQTLNKLPGQLPPQSCDTIKTIPFYDILPIPTDVDLTNPVLSKKDYTGAYIVSGNDISEETGTYTSLQVSDQNTGAKNFSESIGNEGLAITDELNQQNWKLGIGLWQTPVYSGANYVPPCIATDGSTNGSEINVTSTIALTSNLENTATSESGESQNMIVIKQPQQTPAGSFSEAMSGEFNFNNSIFREYGNLKFDQDQMTEKWQLADILLWFGYDACRDERKHLGVYLKMVIPTGTVINQEWLTYALNPVVGNGHHFEFGGGLSAHYDYCQRENLVLRGKVDGYLTHVFNTTQTRWFDKVNLPMSRYAIVKQLQFTGNAENNPLNDNYFLQKLTYLGNNNIGEFTISNDIRAEAIAELNLQYNLFSASLGYAFSGLTADKINPCENRLVNTTNQEQPNSISYGFKGNAPLSTLVVTNINANNETFTPDDKKDADGITPQNYPLVAVYSADASTNLTTEIMVKSSADVTIGGNSGAYFYGNTTNQQEVPDGESSSTTYTGPSSNDLFSLPYITPENRSGLMEGQMLNRLFGKIEYTWESLYEPTLGIVGSYGFTTKEYFTANYWDLGIYVGCTF